LSLELVCHEKTNTSRETHLQWPAPSSDRLATVTVEEQGNINLIVFVRERSIISGFED
jgi:hypothetical protein